MRPQMQPRVRSFAVLAAAATATLVLAGPRVGADGAETTAVPLDLAVWVDCAAGGAGEMVSLTGALHITVHSAERSGSQQTVITSITPQGVVGVGAITGDTYRGAGHTGTTVVSAAAGLRSSQTNNFRVIGPGPGNNLLAHATWHMTTREDGSVVAQVDRVSLVCR